MIYIVWCLGRVCRPRCWFVSDKSTSVANSSIMYCWITFEFKIWRNQWDDRYSPWNIFWQDPLLLVHAANRGCKNYPCSIALRADWKINRYHRARLVSSNRDWFAYYRHTTPIFTHSLYVYAGETIMPPLGQNPAGAKILKKLNFGG